MNIVNDTDVRKFNVVNNVSTGDNACVVTWHCLLSFLQIHSKECLGQTVAFHADAVFDQDSLIMNLFRRLSVTCSHVIQVDTVFLM